MTLFQPPPLAESGGPLFLWPMLPPAQPCQRCGQRVEAADAELVHLVEQGSGREFPAWVHRDVNACKEALA